MVLRDYQQEAVDSIFSSWAAGIDGNYVISLPTGSGKSIVVAELVRRLHTEWGARILMLVHTRELVQQNVDKLLALWPLAPVGIFSAGLGRKELHDPIVFAGIQSIDKHIHKRDAFDIVLVDECHAISTDEGTRYKKTLATLLLMNPNMRVIGLSATPFRLSSGWIHKGDDRIFHHIAYQADILRLINDGWLSNITTRCGKVQINTAGVAHRGSEFVAGELERRAMEGDTTEKAMADMVERAADRKCWIVFAVGIDHAKQITDCLGVHGISAAMVTGDTPKDERDNIISDHKAGRIRCVVNVAVLTTGYDNPAIDMIGLLRPTESAGLHIQILGRGMRKHPGKTDCLILDYSGNCVRFGPIDKINPDKKAGSGDGIAPSKVCPECDYIIPASSMMCPYCGFEFPKAPLKVEHVASEAPVLSSQIEPTERTVMRTWFSVHSKPGKDACVKVEYECGIGEYYYDWVFPKSKFRSQYIRDCKEFGVMAAIDAQGWVAAANGKRIEGPCKIWTIPDGRYTKVVRRKFHADTIPEFMHWQPEGEYAAR